MRTKMYFMVLEIWKRFGHIFKEICTIPDQTTYDKLLGNLVNFSTKQVVHWRANSRKQSRQF